VTSRGGHEKHSAKKGAGAEKRQKRRGTWVRLEGQHTKAIRYTCKIHEPCDPRNRKKKKRRNKTGGTRRKRERPRWGKRELNAMLTGRCSKKDFLAAENCGGRGGKALRWVQI